MLDVRTLTASALCALAVQVGCSQDLTWRAVNQMIKTNYPDVPTITTDSLADRLDNQSAPRPLLLDARTPEEYAVSHLPEARRVDPDASSVPALDTLSQSTPIVVYCSVGYRSARLASRLRDQGFDAVNLKGSIFRWANEGRPVVRDGTPVRAVHPYDDTWGRLLNEPLRASTSPDAGPDQKK